VSEVDREKLLTETYEAFNRRDIDGVLGVLTPDIDWPNAWEGGRVVGHARVRDYWTRQWAELAPTVTPISFSHRAPGTVVVRVHQIARDLEGAVLSDGHVLHVYVFNGPLVSRMDVEELGPDS